MAQEKKKKNIVRRLLGLIVIACFVVAGVFLYKYFADINSQWEQSNIALEKANAAIKQRTDFRKEAPIPGRVIGKIKIDGLTNDMPIIEGSTDSQEDLNLAMSRGVGHVVNTPLPGTYSTASPVAFSAHRETFFKQLQNAKIGDIVTVSMPYGTYQYKISKSIIVAPSESDKVFTAEGIVKERVVLITCYPFAPWTSPSKRIVFFADLIQ